MTVDQINALIYGRVLDYQDSETRSYALNADSAFIALLKFCQKNTCGFVMLKTPEMPLFKVEIRNQKFDLFGVGEDVMPSLAICYALLNCVGVET